MVLEILRELVPGREVRVFGSRARGTARKHSDLDLLVLGSEPLGFMVVGGLIDAFQESDLPMRVDVTDRASVSPSFLAHIDALPQVVIQPAARVD